jgi:hypothetical protein
VNRHLYPKAANVEIVEIDQIDAYPEFLVREISGSYVAKKRLSDAAKVELILAILDGQVRIVNWTVPQLAALFKISVGPIYKARRGTEAHHPRKLADVLERSWKGADPVERLDFAKRVGPEPLFDTAVAAVDSAS